MKLKEYMEREEKEKKKKKKRKIDTTTEVCIMKFQ